MAKFIGNDTRYQAKTRNDIFNFMELFLRYITLMSKIKNKKERDIMLEKFPPADTNYGCIQALTALLKKELMLIECYGTDAFLLKAHELCLQEVTGYIGDVSRARTTVQALSTKENIHIPSALNIILGINMTAIDPIGSIVIQKLGTFWKDMWEQSYERRLNCRLQTVMQEDLDELRVITQMIIIPLSLNYCYYMEYILKIVLIYLMMILQ